MKKILSYIWQFPQVLLAWCMLGINTLIYGKPMKEIYKGVTYYWFQDWFNGISLGKYVLLGMIYFREDIVKHEYGHTCQARKQGPLYLLITGLPSGLGNLYDRIFRTKKRGWTREAAIKAYYLRPWEKKADEYGGTNWKEHL